MHTAAHGPPRTYKREVAITAQPDSNTTGSGFVPPRCTVFTSKSLSTSLVLTLIGSTIRLAVVAPLS